MGTVPRLLGWNRKKIKQRSDELLDLVGLDPAKFGNRYPHELSGGQRQRVGVARALAADPLVLLMDEPFSAVDPIVRGRLQEEFLRLQESVRKTIVLVTHDIDEAVRLGDRIAVLGEGGRLLQYAKPADLLSNPATESVSRFVGTDRGIRRLAVTPLRDAMRPIGQIEDVGRLPSVPVAGTLYDALAAMLTVDTLNVVVTDDGKPVRHGLPVGDLRGAERRGESEGVETAAARTGGGNRSRHGRCGADVRDRWGDRPGRNATRRKACGGVSACRAGRRGWPGR